MSSSFELKSTRVLIGKTFKPARIRVRNGVISEILPYGVEGNSVELSSDGCVDLGDLCVGPGLVDLAPSGVDGAFQGGITTVVLAAHTPIVHSELPQPNIYRFRSRADENGPQPVLLNDATGGLIPEAIIIQTDQTNALASPFRSMSPGFRAQGNGNRWRTGRTRQGSNESEDDEDEESIELPQRTVNVLFELERGSYASVQKESASVSRAGFRGRPPPIVATRTVDYFAPRVFLRNYRFHLSLRDDQVEVDGVLECLAQWIFGILRLSSARALEAVGYQMVCGTTVAHLFFKADDVRDGATWLKLDPPLREGKDHSALLARSLDPSNERFVISSGHSNSHILYDDFERAVSNGPTMPWALSSLWTIAARERHDLDDHEKFAVLWTKFSEIPSTFTGLSSSGKIAVGYDADLVVFDSSAESFVPSSPSVFQGCQLNGRVFRVFLKGQVY